MIITIVLVRVLVQPWHYPARSSLFLYKKKAAVTLCKKMANMKPWQYPARNSYFFLCCCDPVQEDGEYGTHGSTLPATVIFFVLL